METFERLLREHDVLVRPPFNRAARLASGFNEAELVRLEARFVARTGVATGVVNRVANPVSTTAR